MMTASVIQNGDYQAIRIPTEMQTERKEFLIRKVGEGYLLSPIDDPWFPLRLSMGQMPEDFMADREQPSWDDVPEREDF
ncbi:MAG: hypothetical protein IKH16_10870 [Selenomonadaceae bacterium]|nr:hypothetical protein [Selenomonadaceae bacterium]MBR4695066.1 hypothetical protein [Selenomonadaceae bacterium]